MTTTDPDKTIRPFAAFLRELQKGRVHEELSGYVDGHFSSDDSCR